ncbi:hypothetical protein U0070_014176 [Myodes glareolus]|uniref:Uncharacterized protein n=1 Tax=Myodes glareolus TaxID=447135 RepID=A0AAW0INF2_MYOGA
MSSRLCKELRRKYNVRSFPICKDDEVQVLITRLEPARQETNLQHKATSGQVGKEKGQCRELTRTEE